MIDNRRSSGGAQLIIPSYNPQMASGGGIGGSAHPTSVMGAAAKHAGQVLLAKRTPGGISTQPGVIRSGHHVATLRVAHPSTLTQARIVIEEEPEEVFRFRYKSEMSGTHGCIHGKAFDKKNKTFPTIKVENVEEGVDKLFVRVGLYAKAQKHAHHVHKLMMKKVSEKDDEEDFIQLETTRDQSFRVIWKGVGIIHTSKGKDSEKLVDTIKNRKLKVALEAKKVEMQSSLAELSQNEQIQIEKEALRLKKDNDIDMNLVYLGWEAFKCINGVLYPVCNMKFSPPIRNLKNPKTGYLKITRMSKSSGSVAGGDEIFIFTERVIKDDIKVRFFQQKDNCDSREWEDLAQFGETDVHHQYAIAFKTPAFKDQTVTDNIDDVYFELYRPSDGACSEKLPFRYTPAPCHTQNKRRRYDSSNYGASVFRSPEPVMPPPTTVHVSSPFSSPPPAAAQVVDTHHMDYQTAAPVVSPAIEGAATGTGGGGSNTNQTTIDLGSFLNLCNDAPAQAVYVNASPEFGPGGVGGGHNGHTEPLPSMNNGVFTDLSQAYPITVGGHTGVATDSAVSPRPQPSKTPVPGVPQTLEDIVDSIKRYERMYREGSGPANIRDKITHFLGYTTPDGDNLLHTGVMHGDVEILKYLLHATIAFNCKDFIDERNKDGDTPLHLSIKLTIINMSRLLLESGANPNVKNLEGNSAVHLALMQANSNILSQLVNISRINPHLNIANNEGLYPFHLAIKTGKLEIVIIMKEQGCDFNIRDRMRGSTPLHLSLELGHVHITRYLVLKAMVDPTVENFAGQSGVALAQELGLIHLLEPSQPDHRICTPENDKILSEWVTERLSNEDIRLDDFLEKDIKILEQHLRPFDRWKMLAEELGLETEMVKRLEKERDPPAALIRYLRNIDWKVKVLAEALAKILVKDEEPSE
eukprot:TRINITY_DN14814_c0_g1_i2.p1 TRINITY_DN14814_c0_g1~~TRINITY_DN14814_c0_g1_i2.p1  ORF type:complete len:920 (-),score=212.60 TRINITY_DN14814_c0_g1_i2:82-2841(-)